MYRYEKRKELMEKIEKQFKAEDKSDPFSDREYVDWHKSGMNLQKRTSGKTD